MTFTEQYVALMMAILNADGRQAPEEIAKVREMAADLGLDMAEVERLMAAESQQIEKVAKSVNNAADAELLMESCVLVALGDKKLESREVEMLLDIAGWMKLKPTKAVLTIAAIAQNDRSILIEGNGALHDEDTIEEEIDGE